MKPARYDIEIYRGDAYYGPLITLPDLTPFGGPSDLSGPVEVKAQLRSPGADGDLLGEFLVEPIDEAARKIRLWLSPVDTAGIESSKAIWDLQVYDPGATGIPAEFGGWTGTPLAGEATVSGEVTRE